jgi:hypothetical protein
MNTLVMAGLVPAIHEFLSCRLLNSWMPGTSAGHDEVVSPNVKSSLR